MIRTTTSFITLLFSVAVLGSANAQTVTNPELYKEDQTKAYAAPKAGSVKPGAPLQKEEVYKEDQKKAYAKPKEGSVQPGAPLKNKKSIYGESQKQR